MSKDPAVLFYTSDFLTGTMMLSNEQTGQYIKLLCLQHQKGHLTEKDMLKICGTYDEDIFSKFVKEEEKYYNKRMRDESDRRKHYSESRAFNRKKKFESLLVPVEVKPLEEKDMNNISNSYDEHMETENETENENIITTVKKKKNSGRKVGGDHQFKDSEFYEFEKFENEFFETVYEHCDLRIYYEKVKSWAESQGIKRKDWIATTRTFILNDKQNGKLQLKNGTKQAGQGKQSNAEFGAEIDDLINNKYG